MAYIDIGNAKLNVVFYWGNKTLVKTYIATKVKQKSVVV